MRPGVTAAARFEDALEVFVFFVKTLLNAPLSKGLQEVQFPVVPCFFHLNNGQITFDKLEQPSHGEAEAGIVIGLVWERSGVQLILVKQLGRWPLYVVCEVAAQASNFFLFVEKRGGGQLAEGCMVLFGEGFEGTEELRCGHLCNK